MIDLIILLLLNSLYIIGFHNAVDYELDKDKITVIHKQVLWQFAYYTDWLPQLIKIPLYDCLKCMASLHSIIPYWVIGNYDFTLNNLFIYFFYIFALSGLNAIYEAYFDK